MSIKVKLHQTPRPYDREGEDLRHARVVSTGTLRMGSICEELVTNGLYTSQIKGVLDGLVNYIYKSLRDGRRVELEGLGTFSLSVNSRQTVDKGGDPTTEVMVDGVNFRCSKSLKKKLQKAKMEVVEDEKNTTTQEQRKKKMLAFIHKYGHISGAEYTRQNNCSRYRAQKDLDAFLAEGTILEVGKATRKLYVLSGER